MRTFDQVCIWILLGILATTSANTSLFPYCTSIIFDINGRLDIQSMLYNCTNQMQGSLFPPSYLLTNNNGKYSPTVVKFSLSMNNLIKIDDLTSQVVVDFWLREMWVDPRLNFPPETWTFMNPAISFEGLNVLEYRNAQNQFQIWAPDIFAYEMMDIELLSELFKIFPNGTVFRSRHLLVTLQESQMNLKDFPMDTQNLTMTFQSFNYDTNFVVLQFYPNSKGVPTAVSLNKNSNTGIPYLDKNQIWTYDGYSAFIKTNKSPIYFDPNRQYSTAYITFTFSRTSYGIVMRLALPISIFMIIVGFSFWAEMDKRVEVTVNMLLVVAALYLVIGQVIPMVGYFSLMDNYITSVFLVLTFTVGVHFITIQLNRKAHKYPLSYFLGDFMVYFFRLLWVPFAGLLFVFFFRIKTGLIRGALIAITVVSVGVALVKIDTLTKSFKITILNLRLKEKAILQGLSWKDKEEEEKKACHKLQWIESYILEKTRHMLTGDEKEQLMNATVQSALEKTASKLVRFRSSSLSSSQLEMTSIESDDQTPTPFNNPMHS